MGNERDGGVGRRQFNKTVTGAVVGAGLASRFPAVEAQSETSAGEEIWRFETSGAVSSSPTVVDGTVFVGSSGTYDEDREDSALWAVDAETGDEEWRFTEPSDSVWSSPTVVDGTIYVGSHDSNLYAVDAETGDEVWQFTEPSAWVISSPTVVDSTVYVGSHDSNLYAVDAETGDEEWRFAEPSGEVYSSPTVVDGTIYVGSHDSNLYAVDAETGDEEWRFTEPSGLVVSSPTVVDGTVYVGSNDNWLYAVDSERGTEEWRFTESSGGVSSPTVVNNTVFFSSNGLYAVDAETGDEEWRFTELSDGINSSLTVVDGTVYVGSGDSNLYAVGAETGDEEWRFTEPSDQVGSSPMVVNGTVYFGSDDGNLYAVDAGVSGSSEGSRILLGTLGHHNSFAEQGPLMPSEYDGGGSSEPTGDGGTDGTDTEPTDTPDEGGETNSESLPDGLASYMFTAAAVVGVVAVGYGGIRAIVSGGSNEYASKSSESEEGVTTDDSLGGTGDGSETTKTNSPQPPRKQATPTEIDVGYDDLTSKEKVGAGGSADVYRATCNGRTIAVKEPRMSGTLHKSTAKRFIEEAKTWDKLDDHENIVSVLDYGSEPLPWIAMEYMDGGDLSQRDEMSIEEKMRFSVAITNGIRHAHRQGVAHLDLKPENILFRETKDGYYDVPKVTDWGLAKMLLKHSKSIEGMSPQYSAPEQFDEDKYGRPDDKTDIYQLGAVFYELFTGEPPFKGQLAMVMNKVMNEKPTPPSEVADVPTELDDILLTAMAKEKTERYESVLYLRDGLKETYNRYR